MESRGLFVDGASRPAASGAVHEVLDPSTGAPWLEVAVGDADDVDTAVEAAGRALGDWSSRSAPARAAVLRDAAALRTRHEPLAQIESRNVGKPIGDARVEMASVADVFDFYAGVVQGFGEVDFRTHGAGSRPMSAVGTLVSGSATYHAPFASSSGTARVRSALRSWARKASQSCSHRSQVSSSTSQPPVSA